MGIQIANIRKENGKFDILVPEDINIHEGKMYIKNIGNSILLVPFDAPWNNFKESLGQFSDDFTIDHVTSENEIRENL